MSAFMKLVRDIKDLTLDADERIEAIEGIRKGLNSLKQNKGRTADEFFAAFFAKHNIPKD
jgi:hypothetical protein